MMQIEGGYGRKVALLNVCGLGSERWDIIDDVIWILSREGFTVNTFL